MKLSQKKIEIIRDFFKDKPVIKAYLFGSYARNEADNKSDIDLLVDLDYTQHIGFNFAIMKLDLEEKLMQKVDLVSSRGLSPFISPYIENEKQLIYESTSRR